MLAKDKSKRRNKARIPLKEKKRQHSGTKTGSIKIRKICLIQKKLPRIMNTKE